MIEFKNVTEASRMYDLLYELGQEILDKYKPCAKCTTYCCKGCSYLKEGVGCTVKCLECKLWLCSDVSYKPSDNSRTYDSRTEAGREMLKLRDIGHKLGLMCLRTGKAYIMKHVADNIRWERRHKSRSTKMSLTI